MLELDLGIGVAAFDEKRTPLYRLPERYDPQVEDSQWLAVGRELVLSSFGGEEIPAFRVTRGGGAMNERIGRMGGDRGDGGAKAKCVG